MYKILLYSRWRFPIICTAYIFPIYGYSRCTDFVYRHQVQVLEDRIAVVDIRVQSLYMYR